MNYGFNAGAASVLTSMFRQDVAANNLANIETVGFKPDYATTIPRQAAREEDNLFNLPSNAMLERLGAGVLLAPVRTSFDQGSIRQTGNPLDLAIKGPGFLAVANDPGDPQGSMRLTRDGRLTLDRTGRLVTTGEGRAVLDASNRPIVLDPSRSLSIDERGTIYQSGAQVARLNFVDVTDLPAMRKIGTNQFSLPAAAVRNNRPGSGQVLQHSLEASSADPIKAMMDVQNATSAVSSTVRVMQVHDELMNRAINSLGRTTV